MKTSKVKKKFLRYLRLFYSLTFDINEHFVDIELYNDRLIKFMTDYQQKIIDLRKSFISEMIKDRDLYNYYFEYMSRNFDFILFANLNITAVDQRKFSNTWYRQNVGPIQGAPKVRFVVYWYQVIVWELFNGGISIAYWKSRDMGLSYSVIIGETMNLLHERGEETLFTSRVEKDVDISKDTTQTNMGRMRGLIDNMALYSREDFITDKYLALYSSKNTGVKGTAGADPGRQGRFKKIFKDEAGADPKVKQTVGSAGMATENGLYAGTLKNGTDTEFRELINAGYKIPPRELFKLFEDISKSLLEEIKKGLNDKECVEYNEIVNKRIKTFKDSLPVGKTLAFTNNYKDHPLKRKCDNYVQMEKNRLFNDPQLIDDELKGSLHAGNPKRSFWGIEKGHYQENLIEKFNLSNAEVVAGFDPGGDGKAYLAPFVLHEGKYYMLPVEQMIKTDMLVWAKKMKYKYPTMVLIGEASMNALKNVGQGWFHIWRNAGVETKTVTNRNPDLQLACFNWFSIQKQMNYISYEEENRLVIDRENEWFLANYIQGAKYGKDTRQKEYSHPADAVIALIYSQFQHIFKKEGSGYSAY